MAIALAALVAACSASAEPALLDQFFAASRLRDLTALSAVAATPFDPSEHGTVLSYDIVGVNVLKPDVKEVHIRALVRSPRGESDHKTISILLKQIDGRWKVSGFSDVPLAPPTRPN